MINRPNIYFYSDKNREVSVQLSPCEYIIGSIPRYDSQEGWNALVFNGSLDGCNNYLFYEARIPGRSLQRKEAFPVRQDALQSDMIKIMDMYGFNRKETEDFLEYWTKKLRGGEDYLLYPQGTDIIEKIMPLKVSPQPDNTFRLWFLIEKERGQAPGEVHEVRKIIRTSYTVVEWGGIIGKCSEK